MDPEKVKREIEVAGVAALDCRICVCVCVCAYNLLHVCAAWRSGSRPSLEACGRYVAVLVHPCICAQRHQFNGTEHTRV